jgi:high-affinity K+ transport system ATPase subunit B
MTRAPLGCRGVLQCKDAGVSEPSGKSLLGRPYRRLRRWARHTPNGEVALAMMAVGITLVLIAAVVALVAL